MRTMLAVRVSLPRGLALLAAVGVACTDSHPTGPDAANPVFGKAASSTSGPTVTATSPSFGDQGTVNLDVQVIGSGFDQGSQPAWDSGGAPYPKITVNSTKFVSSTQLTANITIAATATVQYYDVAVTTSTGRKGVGTELFTVTLAHPISGATDAVAVNDAGLVTGPDASGIYVYNIGTGIKQDIGFTGTVSAIDQAGVTLAGQTGGVPDIGLPVIWTNASGVWSQTTLPDLGNNGTAQAITADGSAGPGVATLVVGMVHRCGPNGCFYKTPATWTRTSAGGWTLATLALPPGVAQGFAQGVNTSGMVVGMEGTNCCEAFFWDVGGAVTTLPPLVSGAFSSAAWSLNEAGTMIVGNSNGVAVVWTRASTTTLWTTPVALENTRSFCGAGRNAIASTALGINSAGVIVGQSCGAAVAWKPSGGAYARVLLGDLGNHPSGSVAKAINSAATPIAVGSASQGVFWTGF